MQRKKFLLEEKDMPTHWYNIAADMKRLPDPPLHPVTKKPPTPEYFAPFFTEALIEQEMSTERWIEIPEEVREIYKVWRPSPLIRADRLEKALDTPAKIFFKYEGGSPAGSHKPNTAVAQAYYNKKAGVRRLATETGAGQWGSAISLAASQFGLDCTVYMVKVSYEQKPYRRSLMEAWGADVFASPSTHTEAGKKILAEDPESTGSLGIAISEAVEDAAKHEDTKYALGSVLNHVVLHQTVIGLEAKQQMEMAGYYPDVILASCGGGSNFGGIAFPFLQDKLNGERPNVRLVAVEPAACPTLTRGRFAYDYGDSVGLIPLLPMYTLGHSFVPPGIHAGGLRYHGDSTQVSLLYHEGSIEAKALHQRPVFEAAVLFARTEGILPAPEAAHAIRAAIEEAEAAKEAGEERVILFSLSGHGHFDLAAYDQYFSGKLQDYEYPQEEIDRALEKLPVIEA